MSSSTEIVTLAEERRPPRIEEILFVCTGNLCRSPMAAGFLRSMLGDCPNVRVNSAGVMGRGKRPTKEAIRVMRKRGIDLACHVSSSVVTSLERTPDLILAMSREHLGILFELDGRMLARTFTLREFVRLAKIEGPRLPGEELACYIDRVRHGRIGSAMVARLSDDIVDPIGKRRSAYEGCARELKDLIEALSAHLYPDHPFAGSGDRR
jgi:protein-tyrosine phosphatase